MIDRCRFLTPAQIPLLGAALAILVVGFLASRHRAPWIHMWSIGLACACAAKLVTLAELRTKPHIRTPARRLFAYLFWPGMSPGTFFGKDPVARVHAREWNAPIFKLTCGLILIQVLRPVLEPTNALLAGWTGMIGIVLTLHFGLFHLQSLCLRLHGIDAPPIMDQPLLSRSPGELWGRRWNRAFSEPAFRLICRPLARRHGLATATLATFLASGLMHELVITVPAGGAYGLPTAYFLFQGLAVLFQRTHWAQSLGIGSGSRGRLFTLLVAATPLPILFPPVFIERVALPFLRIVTLPTPFA
jgi:hypothetical protein